MATPTTSRLQRQSGAINSRTKNCFGNAPGQARQLPVTATPLLPGAKAKKSLAPDAPAASPVSPAKASAPAAGTNTVFTEGMAAAPRARLKANLGRLNSTGIDPEMIITTALLDRLKHHCHFLETGDESICFSRRTAEAKKRIKARDQASKGTKPEPPPDEF